MGSRGLTRALASLMLERPDLRQRFREIILAAPDIDADVFRDQLAPALAQAGERVTLYASSKDLALRASKEVHGYARAGDSGDGIVVIEGIDTIDASNVDDSILAHSFFVVSLPVIRDIAELVRKQLPPKSRETLRPVRTGGGLHWLLEGN
jgi:esterase/lipase superfamily enzyme